MLLYNALSTLAQHYNGGFDVIIYYSFCADHMNDTSYKHLKRFSLLSDFPQFKFIKSDYNIRYKVLNNVKEKTIHSPWMSKWYHLEQTVQLGYDKILFLDCDVCFYNDISKIFNLDTTHTIYTLAGTCDVGDILYPNKMWINSGQLLVNPKRIRLLNIYDDITIIRSELHTLGEQLFEQKHITSNQLAEYYFFNEQYCAQLYFENLGYKMKMFESIDISRAEEEYAYSQYNMSYINKEFTIANPTSKIIHYHFNNMGLFLPSSMRHDKSVNHNYLQWLKKLSLFSRKKIY